MESASSSVAGPSSLAPSPAALPSAIAVENGSESAAAQPAAASVASNGGGEDHEMTSDALDSTVQEHVDMQEDASIAAPSTASSSNTTAATTIAPSLPTPPTAEPPLSAPAAPSSSSDGRKVQRAAKIKASAMVALASDGWEGSLSASEGPATPVVPNTAPLSRAKRQKNVKFSPPKGPKATGRRTAAAVAAGAIAASGKASMAEMDDAQLPNNDYCETCGGKGHFLCCDGCPRSFHFSCLDPPLELDELPTESWYCKVCEAARKLPVPPKGILGPLVLKAESENPTVFELPSDIKNSFKNVTTGQYGEYIDTNEFRPLSGLGKPGKGGYEDRDPYKTKDKLGRTVLCHRCKEPASQQKHKSIVACDFCEYHWHLDCIDPPLAAMPAITRRFMCPAHADEALPQRRKVLKNQKVIKVKDAHTHNNGDIEIVPMEGRFKGVKHSPEEIISQGLRYQVPEQVVILDFWTKVKRDRYGHLLDSNQSARGETPQTSETFDFSDSSSLTSMEASPEPPRPMPLPQAAVGNSNGQTDGAQLLWLFAKQQSEREGTEVSDGDPPDIGAWQAETEAERQQDDLTMQTDPAPTQATTFDKPATQSAAHVEAPTSASDTALSIAIEQT